MVKIIISPSILEYEPKLEQSISAISEILSCDISYIHVDVMRPPFIPSKTTFDTDEIKRLYHLFSDKTNFDFHLMVSEPDEIIEAINSMVSQTKKEHTIITIHREAYRDQENLGRYASKEYDLLSPTGNIELDSQLRKIDGKIKDRVYKALVSIRELGYKVGLALEPNTSLENITLEMLSSLDMLLIMSVHSGKGGQEYIYEVSDKIKQAQQKYGQLMIQVDGGVNEKTLPDVIKAGANNIVIGSYITKADNLTERIKHIKGLIKRLSIGKYINIRMFS